MKTSERLFNEWIVEIKEHKERMAKISEAILLPSLHYQDGWVSKDSATDFDHLVQVVKEARKERDEHRKQNSP